MKKTLALFALLIAFTSAGRAQDEVLFKLQYKPEMVYTQTMEQTTGSVIKYKASKELLAKLKAKGVENPTIDTKKSKKKTIITTGKATEGQFPFMMQFAQIEGGDGKNAEENIVLYGKGTTTGLPKIDSISSSKELTEEYKKTFIQAIQSTFSQISFPEKKMKPGQKISVETPLSIAVAGVTIDMTINTTYKLLKIANGEAIFDTKQTCTMKTSLAEYDITASGGGNGKLIYDIAAGYFTTYTMNFDMAMKMKLDLFTMDLKTTNAFTQTTVVTKNKNADK